MGAIGAVLAGGQVRTPDLGGRASTRELGQAIREQVRTMAR